MNYHIRSRIGGQQYVRETYRSINSCGQQVDRRSKWGKVEYSS